MLDLTSPPVSEFLDALDIVLNSNTFILAFENNSKGIKESLTEFLNSGYFEDQIIKQDLDRNWNNLHYFDDEKDCYLVRQGRLIKHNFTIKIKEQPLDKEFYLTGMLTGKSGFVSFYSKYKKEEEAKYIVCNFISFITNQQEYEIYCIEPDFLVNTADPHQDLGFYLTYFEGESPNNSSTVIQCHDKSYLLLTNGIP
ncbi:MAG: hypothetical protein U0W24_25240 [Bacteroidales bacterium]